LATRCLRIKKIQLCLAIRKITLQFGIILNNEVIMLENIIQIIGMAGIYIYIYIYIPEISTIPIFKKIST
jgi:hypothetical protein